jgi:hypothetical protein
MPDLISSFNNGQQFRIISLIPCVRIIWDIPEPNVNDTIAVGAEEYPNAVLGAVVAFTRYLNAKRHYVMSQARNVGELCEMNLLPVQGILGVEPGKVCWELVGLGTVILIDSIIFNLWDTMRCHQKHGRCLMASHPISYLSATIVRCYS